MVFKILAIIVVLVLVYMVFFKKNREQDIAKKDDHDHDQITDTLVECPTCGTYVSKDEAILSNGKYYCSKGCLK